MLLALWHNSSNGHFNCLDQWCQAPSISGYGDVWTFTAIDADTKLVPSWLVGLRNVDCAKEFVIDLKNRITNRIQISTDGHGMYLEAVENEVGWI